MNRRALVWLAIAAAVVALAAIWIDRGQAGRSFAGQSGKLWPDLAAQINQIAQIRISRGDGSLVTLQRDAAGWQVRERSYAADAGKIRKLLLDLTALEILEEKTSNPQNYAVLGIDAPTTPVAAGTLLELFVDGKTGGKPAFALVAGKSAGSREIYARRPGDKPGLLLRPAPVIDATPARWLDTTLIDIKAGEIRQLQATPATGAAWTLSRGSAGSAAMLLDRGSAKIAPAPDNNVVTGLLGSFASLGFEDVRAAAATPAPAAERLQLQTFDGLTLDIAGLHEGDKRWVRIGAAAGKGAAGGTADRIQRLVTGHEFEIPTWKYDAIFRKRDEIAPPAPHS
jgi:hypothetical protein